MSRPGSSAAPSAPPIPSPSPSPSPSPWRWQEQQQQQQHPPPPFAYPYPAAANPASSSSALYAAPPYSQPYTAPPPWGAPPPPSAYVGPIGGGGGGGDASYPPPPYGAPFYAQSLFPPGTDPEIIQAFQGADRDGSGVIDENELQRTLSISHSFSLRTARLMVHLYGSQNSSKLGRKCIHEVESTKYFCMLLTIVLRILYCGRVTFKIIRPSDKLLMPRCSPPNRPAVYKVSATQEKNRGSS